MRNKIIIGAIFLLLGVAFYALNLLTPIMHDDIAYLYQYGPKSEVRPTHTPVADMNDVFISQYYHYLDVNGRAPLHIIIQIMMLCGKWLFNILNSFVFVGLIFLLYKFAYPLKTTLIEKITLLLFITVSIWFTTPFVGQTMLWLTGACNYLWGSFFVLLFLYWLKESNTQITDKKHYLRCFILSLLAGWTQESFTIGVSAALFFHYLFHRNQICSKTCIMISGFWIGVLLIIISPGTFNRVNNETLLDGNMLTGIVFSRLGTFIVSMKILLPLFVISLFLLCIAFFKKISIINFAKQNSLLLWSIGMCLSVIILLGMAEDRILFGVSMFICLLNAIFFSELILNCKKSICITFCVISFSMLIVSFSKAYNTCNAYNSYYSGVMQDIKSSSNGIIKLATHPQSRFVNNTLTGISDCNNFHNRVRAFYLNIPSITLLPEEVYSKIIPENQICTLSNLDNNWNYPVYRDNDFLMIEISDSTAQKINTGLTCNYIYNTNKSSDNLMLKPYQRLLRSSLGTLDNKDEKKKGYIIYLNNKQYLLIDKRGIDMNIVDTMKIYEKNMQNNLIISIVRYAK